MTKCSCLLNEQEIFNNKNRKYIKIYTFQKLLWQKFYRETNKGFNDVIQNISSSGPMWYLSERLLWLGEDGNVVVSDTSLNNSAALHTSSLGVSHFTVMQSDLQPMPGMLSLSQFVFKNINMHF